MPGMVYERYQEWCTKGTPWRLMKNQRRKQIISIRVLPETLKRLRQRARRMKRTVSAIACALLGEHA